MQEVMPSRRRFNQALAWAAVGAAMPVRQARPAAQRGSLTLAVAGGGSLYHLPLRIAQQLGFFTDEGLDVRVQRIADGPRAARAALADGAAAVAGAYEDVLRLHALGYPCSAFVCQGRAPQVALGVCTGSASQRPSLTDLRGRAIGMMAWGSSSHMIAQLALSRVGLRATDLSYRELGGDQQALSALRAGQIGAICHTDPLMTLLEQRGEVQILSETRTLRGTQDLLGGPMPGGCLYAPSDAVQARPRTIQALTNAIVRALKWLPTAGPQDLLRAVPQHELLDDPALYLVAFTKLRESISPDGLMPTDGPETALRVLASFGAPQPGRPISLARTYALQFALEANERYRR